MLSVFKDPIIRKADLNLRFAIFPVNYEGSLQVVSIIETASSSSRKERSCTLNERQKTIKGKRWVKTFEYRTEGEPPPAQHFKTTGRDHLGYRELYKERQQSGKRQGVFSARCYLQKMVLQKYNFYHYLWFIFLRC